MMEVGLVIAIVLFAAYAFYALDKERRRAIAREQELLAAVLCKDAEQYLRAVEQLRKQPKDKLKEMELENELAQAAVSIEESRGIPVR